MALATVEGSLTPSWPADGSSTGQHSGAGSLNSNVGAGTQQNHNLSGGSNNQLFSAQNLYYNGPAKARTDTAPVPSSTVPFLRDPDFVDRAELHDLEEKLSSGSQRVGLVGLGGVGKTQLAIEYCYRVRLHSPETWVLWIHASNVARFEESIRKLATDVRVTRKDAKDEVFESVYDWLCDARNGRWLLVLDNADDADFLFESPTDAKSKSRTRFDFLPVCAHGSMIITSRNRAVTRSVLDEADCITVQPMDRSHALTLLERKLGVSGAGTSIEARELVAKLGYMPLAVSQAAAYIKRKKPRCSVKQYLEKFARSERSSINLLKTSTREIRRDHEAKDSILLTWEISFEHILSAKHSAAHLLSLMSFFDYQGIPESLLRADKVTKGGSTQGSASDNGGESDTDSEDDPFEEDIDTLRDYHFISITPNGKTFEMHRLVQLATRRWLQSTRNFDRWAEESIKSLDLVFPVCQFEVWDQCQVLLPHVKLARDLDPQSRDARLRLATVLHKAAGYTWQTGSSDAISLARQASTIRKEILGAEDRITLTSDMVLSMALSDQGEYKDSERIIRETLQAAETVLGDEHPETLNYVTNLGTVLFKQGNHAEAEKMMRRTLEGREKVLGDEHRDTLTSMSNLGLILCRLEEWQSAEPLVRRALEKREKTLGEHPDTLKSLASLALLQQEQGRFSDAEVTMRQVLERRERLFGREHRETLRSRHNLAVLLRMQHKYGAAEELTLQALEEGRRVRGKEHPDTLLSAWELSYLYLQQEKLEAARVQYEDLIKSMIRVLGPTHRNTVSCREEFVSLRYRLQRLPKTQFM